jgi:beta-N-acetylglucosaminidase
MQIGTNIKAGVIEGFFGRPWDWSARLSGADFLGDCGYQFYIYAPKADSFLRRRWREPMPGETLQDLSALGSRCRDRGISRSGPRLRHICEISAGSSTPVSIFFGRVRGSSPKGIL